MSSRRRGCFLLSLRLNKVVLVPDTLYNFLTFFWEPEVECSALGSWWFGFRKQLGDSSIGISKRKHWQRHALWLALRGTPKVFQESLEGHRKNCVGQYRLINNSDWRRKGRCYRSWMAAHSKTSALNKYLGSVNSSSICSINWTNPRARHFDWNQLSLFVGIELGWCDRN